MSHVAKIQLELKDLAALETAGARLGLRLVRNVKTFNSYQRDLECAHRLEQIDNSDAWHIGIVARADGKGFDLLWDSYAGGFGLVAKIGQNAEKLKREYSAAVATKWYSAQGYRVTRQDLHGKIKLSATRY